MYVQSFILNYLHEVTLHAASNYYLKECPRKFIPEYNNLALPIELPSAYVGRRAGLEPTTQGSPSEVTGITASDVLFDTKL